MNAIRTANNNKFEINNLKKTIKSRALKLNATGSMKSSAWYLYLYEDQYPILKNENTQNCWSKYNDNLRNVVLEGDKLMDIQKFWDAMDTAFTSTFNANQGLGECKTLTNSYSVIEIIVPPIGHTQQNQGVNVYKNFTRVLRDHLLKRTLSTKRYVLKYKNV